MQLVGRVSLMSFKSGGIRVLVKCGMRKVKCGIENAETDAERWAK